MSRIIYIRKMRYEDAKYKLEREIHTAFLEGENFVEVIHGIGEGKLKELTLNFVKEHEFLRLFETPDFVSTNPGSTKIEILSISKKELKKLKK